MIFDINWIRFILNEHYNQGLDYNYPIFKGPALTSGIVCEVKSI